MLVALVLVPGLYVGAWIQRLVGFQVLGGTARINGRCVLYEYPAVTGFPLPLVPQRVTRLKRLEQLVLVGSHEAVAQPVGAAVVTKRVCFLFAQVGAKLVGLLQYLIGPHLSHDGTRNPMVI